MPNESGRNTEIIFHMNRDAKDAMTECTGHRTMGDKMHMNIQEE